MDEFEQRLQRQPLRPVPPEWQRDILAAATQAVAAEPAPVAGWREWLWPSPVAWAAVAACWVVIVGLRLAAGSTREQVVQRTPLPHDVAVTLTERRRLLAELETPRVAVMPVRPQSGPPSPHSQFNRRYPEELPC